MRGDFISDVEVTEVRRLILEKNEVQIDRWYDFAQMPLEIEESEHYKFDVYSFYPEKQGYAVKSGCYFKDGKIWYSDVYHFGMLMFKAVHLAWRLPSEPTHLMMDKEREIELMIKSGYLEKANPIVSTTECVDCGASFNLSSIPEPGDIITCSSCSQKHVV